MVCFDQNLITRIRIVFKRNVFFYKNETSLTHAVYRVIHKSLSILKYTDT
jgi:hypothetical protein